MVGNLWLSIQLSGTPLTGRVTVPFDTFQACYFKANAHQHFWERSVMELFNRCQHKQIHWIGKDKGRCEICGKIGHWFEDAELVIWHRSHQQPVPVVLELEGSGQQRSHSPGSLLPVHAAVKTG